MAPLLIPMRYLILVLVLIHSASLYKIYALDDDDRSDLSSNSLSSSWNDDINQAALGYGNEDGNSNRNDDNVATWLSRVSQMRGDEESQEKRSIFSQRPHASKAVPQRRNYRPHWNPLVAAYKRCSELSTSEERESCFKDAIQKLFVHRLRK